MRFNTFFTNTSDLFGNTINLEIQIYVNDELADIRVINAPFEMARLQYMQLVQQLAPMTEKIRMECIGQKEIRINDWETVTKPVVLIYTNEK